MNGHTPGPWVLEPERFDEDGGYFEPMVCTLSDGSAAGKSKEIATIRVGLPGSEANGHLVSAAPDLLEGCRVGYVTLWAMKARLGKAVGEKEEAAVALLQQRMDLIQSAIAKAEGA